MTFGSLFSGIGGLDLGLERAGWECRWQVEIDEFCRRILEARWPMVKRYEDIRSIEHGTLERVDLVAGGFPCQDVSHAGPRIGIDGPRSGLWREFDRIICDLRPRIVLVENVTGLLDRGIERVLGDLAEIGYDAEWDCVSACAFGAPHPRERVFIVAYPQGQRQGQLRRLQCSAESTPKRNVHWAQREPECERVVNGVPDGMDRLKSLGNSVSPIVGEWLGKRILEIAA